MKSRNTIVLCLFALVAVAGCASTKVTDRQQLVTGVILVSHSCIMRHA